MRKDFKFKGKLPCPFCSDTAKNPQGLRGHIQLKHPELYQEWRDAGAAVEPSELEPATETGSTPPRPAPAVTTAQVKAEENRVRMMELQEKGASIEARQTSRNRIPSMLERLGGGGDTPQEQVAANRIMGLDQQPPQAKDPKWYEKMLGNMSVGEALGLARTIVAPGQGQGQLGGNNPIQQIRDTIQLVRELGGMGQTESFLPNDITIPGTKITLPKGFPVSAIALFADSSGRNYLADAFERTLGPPLAEWAAKLASERGAGGGGGGQSVSGEPSQPKQAILEFPCPECGVIVKYNITGAQPGEKVDFVCKSCGHEEAVELYIPEKPTPQPRLKKPKPPKQPEAEIVTCVACGGSVEVAPELPIGSQITCPHCDETIEVAPSKDTVLRAKPAKKEPGTLAERNRRQ